MASNELPPGNRQQIGGNCLQLLLRVREYSMRFADGDDPHMNTFHAQSTNFPVNERSRQARIGANDVNEEKVFHVIQEGSCQDIDGVWNNRRAKAWKRASQCPDPLRNLGCNRVGTEKYHAPSRMSDCLSTMQDFLVPVLRIFPQAAKTPPVSAGFRLEISSHPKEAGSDG